MGVESDEGGGRLRGGGVKSDLIIRAIESVETFRAAQLSVHDNRDSNAAEFVRANRCYLQEKERRARVFHFEHVHRGCHSFMRDVPSAASHGRVQTNRVREEQMTTRTTKKKDRIF